MQKIKIFVSYKDEHRIIKSDIITPIQTGRASANSVFKGMLGDDTGENISIENNKYCELTAQYWVWKNYEKIGHPEYVGFMHYRRHFIFDKKFDISSKERWLPGIDIFMTETFDEECNKNLIDENIIKVINENADCYAIKPYDVRLYFNNNLYMKEHYISTVNGAKRIIYDTLYNVVIELYPEYKTIIDKFTYGSKMNCCNMFIMKKDLFFEYSDFCFKILKEIDKRINCYLCSDEKQCYLGYIGEYLLTLYIIHLEEQKKNVKYLNALLIKDIDEKKVRKFFSIQKTPRHYIYSIGGIKIRIKRAYQKAKLDLILEKLELQQNYINRLENKITELQEELIVKKHRN